MYGNYKVNQAILVRYLAIDLRENISDLYLIATNPYNIDSSPFFMSHVEKGLYQALFIPNLVGWWNVRVKSDSFPLNIYSAKYFVGTEYDSYPSQEDGNLSSLKSQIGEVQISPTTYTLLARLKDIYDKLTGLFTDGLAKLKLWDGTNTVGVDGANAIYVSGKSAPGIAPSSNPVYISGIDSSGLKRGVLTDTLGRLHVSSELPQSYFLTLGYNATANMTAIMTLQWYKGLYYTVPMGYKFYATQFLAEGADNRMSARASKFISFGTYDINIQTFTDGSSYSAPRFASSVEAEVTTIMGNVNVVILTVTYVNQDGVGGRTGTVSLAKLTPVGVKAPLVLQSGDYGVRDITAVSRNLANTGIVQFNGNIELFYTACPVALTTYPIIASKDSIVVVADETVALDFSVNANSNVNRIIKLSGLIVAV